MTNFLSAIPCACAVVSYFDLQTVTWIKAAFCIKIFASFCPTATFFYLNSGLWTAAANAVKGNTQLPMFLWQEIMWSLPLCSCYKQIYSLHTVLSDTWNKIFWHVSVPDIISYSVQPQMNTESPFTAHEQQQNKINELKDAAAVFCLKVYTCTSTYAAEQKKQQEVTKIELPNRIFPKHTNVLRSSLTVLCKWYRQKAFLSSSNPVTSI